MLSLRALRATSLWRVLAAFGFALVLVATTGTGNASAHGAISDPPSRAYDCYTRWASNWQDPAMETEDPMCYQAWQADPNAMWNWNGQLRNGVGGDHQAAVPDGTLCSAGLTENGRYAALDKPGPWKTTPVPSSFTMNLLDNSHHGADYIRVYATTQGFDPTTDVLTWGDLELVGEETNIPTSPTTPIEVNAPGRSGHHILFTVWQASHADQSYYFCSDVEFTS